MALEAAVVGSNVAAIASEVAGKKLAKVYAIENAKLEPYTPDAFRTCAQAIRDDEEPQARADAAHLSGARFYPQARHGHGTHRLSATASDTRRKAKSCVFTRQMFQGKFAADVSFTERRAMVRDVPERCVSRRQSRSRCKRRARRNSNRRHPRRRRSQQAARSIQGSQAGSRPDPGRNHRLRGTRHQGAEKHRTRAETGRGLGRGAGCIAAHLRQRMAPDGPPDRFFWPDRRPQALPRPRYLAEQFSTSSA